MKILGFSLLMALCLVLNSCGEDKGPVEADGEAKVEAKGESIEMGGGKMVSEPRKENALPDGEKRMSKGPRPDCVMLDQPEGLRAIFYPRRNLEPIDDLDFFFPVADDIRLSGRLYVAEKDSPLILYFHGNGEIASDYDGSASLYTEMGVSLLVVDFRGYGKSGGFPTASFLLNDAAAVYSRARDLLSERGLDVSRLFIMGRSLGSAAAIEAAALAGDDIDGLIIESGFASALPFIGSPAGPLPDEVKAGIAGFDNAEKISRLKVPTLVIHGEADRLLPIAHGIKLYNSSGGERKKLVTIPDAGHNDLSVRGQALYFSAIREFIFGQST